MPEGEDYLYIYNPNDCKVESYKVWRPWAIQKRFKCIALSKMDTRNKTRNYARAVAKPKEIFSGVWTSSSNYYANVWKFKTNILFFTKCRPISHIYVTFFFFLKDTFL